LAPTPFVQLPLLQGLDWLPHIIEALGLHGSDPAAESVPLSLGFP
jgi:hypothetical protein